MNAPPAPHKPTRRTYENAKLTYLLMNSVGADLTYKRKTGGEPVVIDTRLNISQAMHDYVQENNLVKVPATIVTLNDELIWIDPIEQPAQAPDPVPSTPTYTEIVKDKLAPDRLEVPVVPQPMSARDKMLAEMGVPVGARAQIAAEIENAPVRTVATTVEQGENVSVTIHHKPEVKPEAVLATYEGPMGREQQIAWMAMMKCATQVVITAPDRGENAFAEADKVLLITERLYNHSMQKFETGAPMTVILGVPDV